MAVDRVVATEGALALIAELHAKHGELIFYQSGGCCDGSTPMCFTVSEMQLAPSDVRLGELGASATPFYISVSQYEYWKHTQLIIDVSPGRTDTFSLSGDNLSFITRSRLFTDEEWAGLVAAGLVSN